jgi:hypothetical protein
MFGYPGPLGRSFAAKLSGNFRRGIVIPIYKITYPHFGKFFDWIVMSIYK